MNLKNATLLLKEYDNADIFQQNKLAVDFVELYGRDLLRNALNCRCSKDAIDHNLKLVEDFESAISSSITKLKKELLHKEGGEQ